jgi:hypothetical protein
LTDLPAQLRLALALAHNLPGGAIELATAGRPSLRAAHGPPGTADLTPCELRAALLARACPFWPGVAARLSRIAVSGDGVRDLGGDLFARSTVVESQRWFATFLAPTTVQHLLQDCPVDMPVPVDASLRPDIELGVVVVVLSTPAHRADVREADLDEAARWASAACFVQELLHAARAPSSTS